MGTCSIAMALTDSVSNATPRVGDTIVYTLTGAPAFTASTTVTVTDTLGTGLTFVSADPSVGTYASSTGAWNVGTLNGASAVTLTITATVDAGTEGQTIANTPGITYVQSNCTESSAVTGVSITVQGGVAPTSTAPVADIAITKTADVATTTEGSIIHYTITAWDNGPSTSTGVVATDTLPSGLTFLDATASAGSYSSSTGTWTIGALAPNATATLEIAAIVNTGTAGHTIVNTATIGESSSETDPNLANNTAAASVYVKCNNGPTAPVADIAITKVADVATTTEGGTIHYTITATDNGPSTSTDVVATDTLPAGLTFVSASTSVGTYSTSTGAWTIGTLAPSSTATLELVATANAGTAGQTIANTATIGESSKETDPNLANNSATATVFVESIGGSCSVSASFTNSVNDAAPRVGDTIVYTLTNSATAFTEPTHLLVHDMLGAGLTFASATVSTGTYSSSTGVWDIGTLNGASTQVLTLTLTATVNPGTEGQTIPNDPTAEFVGSGCTSSSAIASAPVTVQAAPVIPSADLAITKTADVATTTEGSIIHYTITAWDNGPSTSTGVVATDTLPSGLTFENATASVGTYSSSTGAWTIGDLAPSSTATLAIAALVNAGTAGTTIVNTATIGESASTTDPNPANNTASSSVYVMPNGGCGSCQVADIAIVKTVDNANPDPGATIHYTLTVTDNGPSTSTNVVAHDQLPPTTALSFLGATTSQGTYNLSTGDWTIGTVGPHATATLELAAVVGMNQAGQTIVNTATVSQLSSITDPNLANNTATATIVVATPGVPSADLAITKTADVATTTEGSTVHYTITATDNGPSTSTDVVATDTLPSGLTFENATASVGTYSSSTGTWTIGDLAPSSTATLAIAALVNAGTAGTTIVNIATIGGSASTTDPNPANNTASSSVYVQGGGNVGTQADIAVAKSVDNARPLTGSTVHYTITAWDNGPAASTDVVATDTLPAGLTFVSANPSVGTYSTSTGAWTIGTLGINATATLAIAATVNAGTSGQAIVNTVTIGESSSETDPNPANNTATATITPQSGGGGCTVNCGGGSVPTAEIGIVKTVDNANPSAGATIHYTLTVSATGPSPSVGVVAKDVLPGGVTFVSASSSLGSFDPSSGVWTIGNMNVGQSATLVITATVDAADPAGETITNTGTVSESLAVNDQNSANNTSSVTITVAGGGGGGTVIVGGGSPTSTGIVLGTSTPGIVLGTSTCGLYLDEYIHPIRKYLNTSEQVKKLQLFLNANLGTSLPITGYYGPLTQAAVNRFQTKYHTEILLPWVPLGLPTEFTPTGYVYQATWRWINLIECPSLNLPIPAYKVDDFATSYSYAF